MTCPSEIDVEVQQGMDKQKDLVLYKLWGRFGLIERSKIGLLRRYCDGGIVYRQIK